MEVAIRDYRPGDGPAILSVFRDANNVLRKSRGGQHPDDKLDRLLGGPDKRLLAYLTYGNKLLVAEADGEVIGFVAFSDRPIDHLLKSSYGASLYVKERFQRGRQGVNVGLMLVAARLEALKKMNFRKIYSYVVPESVGFVERWGGRFYPIHDSSTLNSSLRFRYFEVELRPSIWNKVRIEPFIFEFKFALRRAVHFFKGGC